MSANETADLAAQIGKAIGPNAGLGGTLKFDFGGDGYIYMDGRSSPNSVTTENRPADCTITVSLENFKKMLKGELDGTAAFMTGKLRVAGDMGLAMKLGPLLQKARRT